MSVLIIQSQVEDYDRWREVYDSNQDIREAAGLAEGRVLRSADDSNHVTVILEGDLQQLRSFGGSEELRERMREAGVVGPPTMMFADEA